MPLSWVSRIDSPAWFYGALHKVESQGPEWMSLVPNDVLHLIIDHPLMWKPDWLIPASIQKLGIGKKAFVNSFCNSMLPS